MPDETTPTEPTKTTSEALFPEYYETATPAPAPGEQMMTTPPAPEAAPTVETPPSEQPELTAQQKAAMARPRDEHGKFVPREPESAPALSPEAKVKTKIGGVEEEKTLAEILKGYQTDQYLTRKGQKLAEQEKRLKDLEAQLSSRLAAPVPAAPAAPKSDDWMADILKPYVSPLEAKIKELEAQLSEVNTGTHSLRKQAALDGIDQQMRELGLTDFKRYVPQIEAHIQGLDEADYAEFNTPKGYAAIYKDLKLRELGQPKPAAPSQPSPDQRPKPTLMPVESGGGSPSLVQTGEAVRQKDFEAAKSTGGDLRAWAAYLNKHHP